VAPKFFSSKHNCHSTHLFFGQSLFPPIASFHPEIDAYLSDERLFSSDLSSSFFSPLFLMPPPCYVGGNIIFFSQKLMCPKIFSAFLLMLILKKIRMGGEKLFKKNNGKRA